MPFDPNKYLIDLKGKPYLQVAHRLVWFREDHPDWSIVTTPVEINLQPENNRQPYAIFSATILNADGKIMATATKMEDQRGFPDFLEKAETGSVGRALAYCGYGTAFAPELEEGNRLADAPQETRQARPQPQQAPQPPAGQRQPAAASALPEPICVACGKAVTEARLKTCYHGHKPVACPTTHCQQRAAAMAQQPGPGEQMGMEGAVAQ